MQKVVDGKNYYTVEFELTSANFSRASFVTLAIGNGNLMSFYHIPHRIGRKNSYCYISMSSFQPTGCVLKS